MAQQMLGVSLEISGEGAEARASSLVHSMLATGLAEELGEELLN